MTTQSSTSLWRMPESTAADQAQIVPLVQDLHHQLRAIAQSAKRVALANSLAVEDMVLSHAIAELGLSNIEVFVLETGKLHTETLAYLEQVKQHYPRLTIAVYKPLPAELKQFEAQHEFINIYQSLDTRKACCYSRKIEPLKRALHGYDAWITGQRREQSNTRSALAYEEFDSAHQMPKFNTLADWSQQQVWAYIQQHRIPVNPLYQQGVPSIGCEPCTRPIRSHEDLRAGRWWWENSNSKECGLHTIHKIDG